jgi:hypothetical protein
VRVVIVADPGADGCADAFAPAIASAMPTMAMRMSV